MSVTLISSANSPHYVINLEFSENEENIFNQIDKPKKKMIWVVGIDETGLNEHCSFINHKANDRQIEARQWNAFQIN